MFFRTGQNSMFSYCSSHLFPGDKTSTSSGAPRILICETTRLDIVFFCFSSYLCLFCLFLSLNILCFVFFWGHHHQLVARHFLFRAFSPHSSLVINLAKFLDTAFVSLQKAVGCRIAMEQIMYGNK